MNKTFASELEFLRWFYNHIDHFLLSKDYKELQREFELQKDKKVPIEYDLLREN